MGSGACQTEIEVATHKCWEAPTCLIFFHSDGRLCGLERLKRSGCGDALPGGGFVLAVPLHYCSAVSRIGQAPGFVCIAA